MFLGEKLSSSPSILHLPSPFLKFNFIVVELLYNVVLVSGVQQSESVIYVNISILFSHLDHYKQLSRFSCAILQVPVNHLFYTVACMCYSHLSNSSLLSVVSFKVTTKLVFPFFFFFVRAAPVAYGSCQARGPITAVAASLHHSHSNIR